ncbi:YcaO-like family protein [Bacillus stercoris]|nr:YcaO-like family protein [Bacillus stercoris]
MREAASSRIAMMAERPAPQDIDDFYNVFHGATYMGKAERLHAYDFLVHSPNQSNLSELPNLEQENAGENLKFLLNRLEEKGLEAFAVDLTTDEAIHADMRVVRVIIPGLQPLSFSYRCRF